MSEGAPGVSAYSTTSWPMAAPGIDRARRAADTRSDLRRRHRLQRWGRRIRLEATDRHDRRPDHRSLRRQSLVPPHQPVVRRQTADVSWRQPGVARYLDLMSEV